MTDLACGRRTGAARAAEARPRAERPEYPAADRAAPCALVLTPVTSRHLSPAVIEDDIPHQFRIIGRRVGRDLERLEYGSSAIERLNQLVRFDALHTEHPIEPAEILNREFHPSIVAEFPCQRQREPIGACVQTLNPPASASHSKAVRARACKSSANPLDVGGISLTAINRPEMVVIPQI